MRFRLCLALATVALAALVSPARAVVAPATPTNIVQIDSSECAVWDAATNAWYVSSGTEVVKLEAGQSTAQVFVDGLGGAQGVRIHDGTMYIADGDHILAVSMADPSEQTALPTGGGANDVDIDPATGDLYVTDLGGNVVWQISGGVSTVFAEINAPDGIIVKDGGVYVDNFAFGGAAGLYRFELGTAERSTVVEIPGATLDGLEPDGDDWIATDFTKGHVWRIAPDGGLTLIAQLLPGTADLGIDHETNTAAIPNLLFGAVVFMTI